MFTGIITDLGEVVSISGEGDPKFTIATAYETEAVPVGASIACNGVCLSVVDKGPGWFAMEASAETLSRTTLGAWRPGTAVNLERPLKLGDELGGHMVAGHVDGVGEVLEIRPDGASLRFSFRAPAQLARFIAPKGSVAVDGVSLTVNEVDGPVFGVNIIPVTREKTSFGALRPGDRVNLEIDLLARYLARLMEAAPR